MTPMRRSNRVRDRRTPQVTAGRAGATVRRIVVRVRGEPLDFRSMKQSHGEALSAGTEYWFPGTQCLGCREVAPRFAATNVCVTCTYPYSVIYMRPGEQEDTTRPLEAERGYSTRTVEHGYQQEDLPRTSRHVWRQGQD